MNLSRMPASLIAGDSLRLAIPVGDYPADEGWAVSLVLQALAGAAPVTVNASDDDGDWLMVLASANSADLVPGGYRYLIAATKDGDRQTIDHGDMQVRPDPAKPATDQRSPARRALDAIDAVLENRASSEDMKFTFADGRALEKVPHADLLALRKHYARIVARETNKGRGPKRVLMRL
jgi:hypothetical protein